MLVLVAAAAAAAAAVRLPVELTRLVLRTSSDHQAILSPTVTILVGAQSEEEPPNLMSVTQDSCNWSR